MTTFDHTKQLFDEIKTYKHDLGERLKEESSLSWKIIHQLAFAQGILQGKAEIQEGSKISISNIN